MLSHMAGTSRCLVLVVAILVLSAGGTEFDSQRLSHAKAQSSTPPVTAAIAGVTDSYSEVDLGKRIVGERLQQTFRVQNTTPTPITILCVSKSCGCEKANVTPGSVVQAGAMLDVAYAISSQIPGTRRGQLTLQTDSSEAAFKTLAFSLRAEILPRLESSPRQLFFTSAGDTTPVPDAREIVIRSNVKGLLERFQNVESAAGLVAVKLAKSNESELVLKAVLNIRFATPIRRDFIIVHFDDSEQPSLTIPVTIQERSRLIAGTASVGLADEPARSESATATSSASTSVTDARLPVGTTAVNIVERMQKTMALPIRYRLGVDVGQGFNRTVALKRLPDGTIAMRLEMAMKITNATTLLFGGQVFKYYANENMAIDIAYQPDVVRKQAEEFAAGIEKAVQECDLATARLLGVTQRDGVTFWEIEATIPIGRQEALAAIVEATTRETIPVRYRFLIEQARGVLAEIEAYSISGNSLSFKQFADVEIGITLPDETFQLPQGVEVLIAKSVQDYSTMMMAVLKKHQPSRLSKPVTELPGERPWEVPLEQVHQQLAKDREELLVKAKKHLEAKRKEQDEFPQRIAFEQAQPPAQGTWWWILIIANLLALMITGWLVVIRRSG